MSASTDQDRENRAVWRVFNCKFKSSRKYEIKTQNGVKTIHVIFNKLRKNEPSNESVVMSQIINDIGYLKIGSMRGNVVSDFIREYEKVKKTHYLMLDIRDNNGGSSGNGEEILSFLIKKNNPLVFQEE